MPKLALLAAAALASTAVGVAAGASTRTASLRLVDNDPLTLRGSAFQAGERVRVTVWSGRRWERRVRAGPTGAFRIVFLQVHFGDPCTTDFHATAVGGDGSIARIKRPQRLCPMPLGGPNP